VTLTRFRAHIVRGTHHSLLLFRVRHYFADTEVPNLNSIVACQKNILSFDISVYHRSTVKIVESTQNLNQPIENIGLVDILILLFLALNVKTQVTN
jgi:hypothetical protein